MHGLIFCFHKWKCVLASEKSMDSIHRVRTDVDKARKKTQQFFQYDQSDPHEDFGGVQAADKPLEKYLGIDKLQKGLGLNKTKPDGSQEEVQTEVDGAVVSRKLNRDRLFKENEEKFSLGDTRRMTNTVRLFNRDGTINVQRKHMTFNKLVYQLKDPFHTLLNTSWKRIIIYVWAYYVFVWLIFAIIYYLCPGVCLGKVENAGHVDFVDAFLFSVETQTTIKQGKDMSWNRV
eukprot:TRINITY_DN8917_c0_g1_i1.p1 TRINITY_DN8917_c0_g1~~TRINITY_DN8917_c0_g1_i1.p1  ORF type:complete len:232 (-),score=27.46 TRINITY_DN8917_c0_g1_i1:278-973(-)